MDNPLDTDQYLDLKALSAYSSMAVPTLRDHLRDIRAPLPHFKVKGKILVKRSEFNNWLEGFRVNDIDNLEQIVEGALKDLTG